MTMGIVTRTEGASVWVVTSDGDSGCVEVPCVLRGRLKKKRLRVTSLVVAAGCRFRDCSHTHEPDCAVKQAVARGEIDPDRYRNYVRLRSHT